MEYTDYIKASQSRIERSEQLRAKYSQQPIYKPTFSFWSHNIERHESTNELAWLCIVFFAIGVAGVIYSLVV